MPNEQSPCELLTIPQAATMSDRSHKTIRNWIKSGKISAHKENPNHPKSRLLISKEELQMVLATKTIWHPPRKNQQPLEETRGTPSTITNQTMEIKLAVAETNINHHLETISKLEKKLEKLESERNSQMATHKEELKVLEEEKRILLEKLSDTERNLQSVSNEYDSQVAIGWFRRMVISPKPLNKLLTMKEEGK